MSDKFRTTRHAEPYVFTTGLDLVLISDVVVSTMHAVGVAVEFTYSPGEAPRRYGHPDDWDEGVASELTITAVKLADPATFGAPGLALTACALVDILPLLSAVQVAMLEVAMDKRLESQR